MRLFASAREAAGTARDEVAAGTVGELLDAVSMKYGDGFVEVLRTCRIWVNGETAERDTVLRATDEVAVIPPVSGGTF